MKNPTIFTSDRKQGSAKQVLILHGWGASSKSFQEVKQLLETEGFEVTVPDLPGFGDEPLTHDPMTFDDYVAFVKKLITQKTIIIGHSFGGRIAIRFAKENPEIVEKLILTGASGIIHPLTLKKTLLSVGSKVAKPIFGSSNISRKILYKAIGESDYLNAGQLAQTFKNVHRVSIENDLNHVTVPTLLVWGEKDIMVPLVDGRLMHDKIKDSKLIVVKGVGHRLPYQMPHVFVENILPFLKGNK